MSDCIMEYTVEYYDLTNLIVTSSNFSSVTNITWGRKLDDISKAVITHSIPDSNCLKDLSYVEPIRGRVLIKRNGENVWFGVITAVELSSTAVKVEASDVLHWLTLRVPHGSYTLNADQADHFKNLWELSVNVDDPGVTIITSPTGIVQTREYNESRYRITWNIVREMLDSGLDVCAIGNTIYAGVLENLTVPLTLTSEDIASDTILRKDGNLFANKIYFNASGSITGIFPPSGSDVDSIYPLVELVLSDSELKDQTGADASAKSRWDFSQVVPRVVQAQDSLLLSQSTRVSINEYIPSRIVNLDISDLIPGQSQSYRLGAVDVNVAGSDEQITVSLQPYGTFEQLADYQEKVTDSGSTAPDTPINEAEPA